MKFAARPGTERYAAVCGPMKGTALAGFGLFQRREFFLIAKSTTRWFSLKRDRSFFRFRCRGEPWARPRYGKPFLNTSNSLDE